MIQKMANNQQNTVVGVNTYCIGNVSEDFGNVFQVSNKAAT